MPRYVKVLDRPAITPRVSDALAEWKDVDEIIDERIPEEAGLGDVVGPASAVGDHLAVFNGTTGKLLKDGGAVPAGITNSAGANIVPRSNGTNLIASNITDDGVSLSVTIVNIGGDEVDFTLSPDSFALLTSGVNGNTQIQMGSGAVSLLGANGAAFFGLNGNTGTIVATGTNGVIQSAPASTPAANLSNGQISFYLDESGHKLKVAVKYSNGTTKTGEIALT